MNSETKTAKRIICFIDMADNEAPSGNEDRPITLRDLTLVSDEIKESLKLFSDEVKESLIGHLHGMGAERQSGNHSPAA